MSYRTKHSWPDKWLCRAVCLFGVLTSIVNARPSFNLINMATPADGILHFGANVGFYLGQALSSAGDFNNDGKEDYIVSSSNWGQNRGITYVIFGPTAMQNIDFGISITGINSGFIIWGANIDDRSGFSASAAGDVNGDGISDIVIGAYSAGAGIVYVFFGRTVTGPSNALQDIFLGTFISGPTIGFRIYGATSGDWCGFGVGSAGDINNDGIGDIVLGAISASVATKGQAGIVYVVYGRVNLASDIALSAITGTSTLGFRVLGARASDYIGNSVMTAGDMNGDGRTDIVIGAGSADSAAGVVNCGAVYVIFGRTQGSVFSDIDMATMVSGPSTGFRILGINTQDIFGECVSAGGDINGDGLADIVIGARLADPYANRLDAGVTYVVFGRTSVVDISLLQMVTSPTTGFRILGAGGGDQSGTAVSGLGDFNGDGLRDIIIGAPNALGGKGTTYVLYGQRPATMTFVEDVELSSLSTGSKFGFSIFGANLGDSSGGFVQSAGDINGDGADDMLISAKPSSPLGRANSGIVYLLLGQGDTPTSQPSSQPSRQPSSRPTSQPSCQPSRQPSSQPSGRPSSQPSAQPSNRPTTQPVSSPSAQPSTQPSTQPTSQPVGYPSSAPTLQPQSKPTSQPSTQPTSRPTIQPSALPSTQPSQQPTSKPSSQPSNTPSTQPSTQPSSQPSSQPSRQPSMQPTVQPSVQPSAGPSTQPSGNPSAQPSTQSTTSPSRQPTSAPSMQPSAQPSSQPTSKPSAQPSRVPSAQPSIQPSVMPTATPTSQPSRRPTSTPSAVPTVQPSVRPSTQPTSVPSLQPTSCPSSQPSAVPSVQPSSHPTHKPSAVPSSVPSTQPTGHPSSVPSVAPTTQPSGDPSVQPKSVPSTQPTAAPSMQPSVRPSQQPFAQPSTSPTVQPTTQPTTQPTSSPSIQPTSLPTAAPPVGEWVTLIGNQTTATSVRDSVWGCGDRICTVVGAASGDIASTYVFPWDVTVSVLELGDDVLMHGITRSAVPMSHIANCAMVTTGVSCSLLTFPDVVLNDAARVPFASKVLYVGNYNVRTTIIVKDVTTSNVVLNTYSASNMKSLLLTHVISPPAFVGAFVAGTSTRSTGTAAIGIVLGMVRTDQGMLSAMSMYPVSGDITKTKDLVTAIALENSQPDAFIVGGLQTSEDRTGMHAYLLRANGLFMAVKYCMCYRHKGNTRRALCDTAETVHTVMRGVVLINTVLYMVMDVHNAMTNATSISVLRTNSSTGLILQQVHIHAPNTSIRCTDLTSTGTALILACTTSRKGDQAQSLLIAADLALSFSRLPVGFVKSVDDVFFEEPIPFQRSVLTVTKQSAVFAVSESVYNSGEQAPSRKPSAAPSVKPSSQPSSAPSAQPSSSPTAAPTLSARPTSQPSSAVPTNTHKPTPAPSPRPSFRPSLPPSPGPTPLPSLQPSIAPSTKPSVSPSTKPSVLSTMCPTKIPTTKPTSQPRSMPTTRPSRAPSSVGSELPEVPPSKSSWWWVYTCAGNRTGRFWVCGCVLRVV